MSLFLLTNFISAQSVISDVQCSNNGTFNTAADDFVAFKLNPQPPGGIVVHPFKYNISATYLGNPVTITDMAGVAVTQGNYGENPYYRINNGTIAAAGNIVITLTAQFGAMTQEVVNLTNPGTCSTVCTGASTGNKVTYYYENVLLLDQFTSQNATLPKFDEGTSRTLTGVKIDYGFTASGSVYSENREPNPHTLRIKTEIEPYQFDINTVAHPIASKIIVQTPGYPTSIPVAGAVLVPASGAWPGDDPGVAPDFTASTLTAMGYYANTWLESAFASGIDPTTNPLWVTQLTGNAGDDDDIIVVGNPTFAFNAPSINLTAPLDLNAYKGASTFPIAVDAYGSIAVFGGGGLFMGGQSTKARYFVKVEYTYDCISQIDAVNDTSSTPINGTTGGDAGINVYDNDTLNGNPATASNVTLTSTPTAQLSINPTTGAVTVTPNTPAGTYTIDYTICDTANPGICDTATVTITVFDPCAITALNPDSDGDGISNFCDDDDDNDGILDTAECGNILKLSGFENISGLSNGNNFGVSIAPWILGPGDAPNVVQVDGAGGFDYGSSGPFEDADPSTGAGVPQHYLDILNGFNSFYQVFTIPSTTTVTYSGYFSSRDNVNGNGSLSIYTGSNGMFSGTLVDTSGLITISAAGGSEFAPWVFIERTVTLTPGTYSFVGYMNNDANFDDGKVEGCMDTDNDGTPDYLDLDSDGDGCPDAIEGDENVLATHLSASGAINVGANGTGTLSVNANGVPNLVNAGGLADVGSDVGQGLGSSQDALVTVCFIDAVNDINQTPVNTPVSGNVLTNDEAGSTITVQSATYINAAGATVPLPLGTATQVYTSTGTLAGSMILNADGTYTFTPATVFTGTVPVNYTAVNSVGSTDTATLEISVIPSVNTTSNDNPIAQNDTSFTEAGVTVSSTVLNNDSDPDGDALTVTSATGLTIGTATVVSGVNAAGTPVANAGTVQLNANGTYTYVPAAGFVGTVNPLPYVISDGNGGTATANIYITVVGAGSTTNNTFANDDANSAPKGVTMTGNVKTNDTDPEGNTTTVTAATVFSVNGVANGTALTIGTATVIPGVGSVTLNANGTYSFVPVATYVGTVVIPYTICDNGVPQACDQATLELTSLDIVLTACYDLPNTATAGVDTKHGITILQRAGADNGNWPMIRKSAHTALESNTKGFVITRMTTAQVTAIVSPQEGMMVYDTTAKCLKLYDGTAWSCFVTPTCP